VRTVVGPEGWEAVERAGRRTARRPVFQNAARVGYAARGAVYAVIAVLALALAAGAGGRTTDSKGAVASIASAPAGRILVAVLALGLAALGLWLVVDAIADTGGRRRSGAWAVASRAGQAVSGLAYGSLAYAAVRLALLQDGGRGGDAAARSWTARALELPAGRILVFGAAAVALFVGAKQIWNGLGRRFVEQLELSRMSPRLRRWASRLGAVGFTAQGVVFGVVGILIARAALEHDPRQARGFDGALQEIARQPPGTALLAAVAVGLLAYAAYAFIDGAYRKMGGR
jgi:hypothetical protein